MLRIASLALAACALVGGLSDDVGTYIVSALILGVFFAMHSGTLDAVIYDTVLEETGRGDEFERRLGRVRLTESVALVIGSLVGGGVASLTSTRLTYLLTVPFALLSVAAYGRFREPRLHQAGERSRLRAHVALTYRTLAARGRLQPIIALTVLASVVFQLVLEFGPLWLVALAAPALLFGPYWAGLMSSFGIGGALAGRFRLDRPGTAVAVSVLMVSASGVLGLTDDVGVAIVAQIVLAVLVVVARIHVTRLLHDAVPSSVRSGVASGAGAMSWVLFLPVALVFGALSGSHGVRAGGWMLTVVTALAAGLLVRLSLTGRRPDGGLPISSAAEGEVLQRQDSTPGTTSIAPNVG